jgi:hypothetical protein
MPVILVHPLSLTYINVDAEEIWITNALQASLGSAEEEARAAPSHEACGVLDQQRQRQEAVDSKWWTEDRHCTALSGLAGELTKLGRRKAAPEAVMPMATMGVDGHRLHAEVVLLEISRQVLVQ